MAIKSEPVILRQWVQKQITFLPKPPASVKRIRPQTQEPFIVIEAVMIERMKIGRMLLSPVFLD